jgi:hypothetical protein
MFSFWHAVPSKSFGDLKIIKKGIGNTLLRKKGYNGQGLGKEGQGK